MCEGEAGSAEAGPWRLTYAVNSLAAETEYVVHDLSRVGSGLDRLWQGDRIYGTA
jgi:hypothetical protein